MSRTWKRPARRPGAPVAAAGVTTLALLLSACAGTESDAESTGPGGAEPVATLASEVTLTNCGEDVAYETPVERMFVNDGNMIDLALALGTQEQVTAVSNMTRHEDVLRWRHGDVVDSLNEVSESSPSLEPVIAAAPDLVYAGWSYGFRESTGLTPETLAGHGIPSYILSESCRSGDDGARGIMDPWDALRADLENVGALTARTDEASALVADLDGRLDALRDAPAPDDTVEALLFDSFSDTVTTSGRFGGPQEIMASAGAHNIVSDLDDTWTQISWERIAATEPDIVFFVDYPPQSFAEKVAELESNPATRDLEAVREGRFVNLPYLMWTSGPMNIDAAELLRAALEHYELAPGSGLEPAVDITELDLPGNEWAEGQ